MANVVRQGNRLKGFQPLDVLQHGAGIFMMVTTRQPIMPANSPIFNLLDMGTVSPHLYIELDSIVTIEF